MPNKSLSRRVVRLVTAASKSSTALHQIKTIVDAYMVDGVDPARSMAAIALALTHHNIAELESAVAEFGEVAS